MIFYYHKRYMLTEAIVYKHTNSNHIYTEQSNRCSCDSETNTSDSEEHFLVYCTGNKAQTKLKRLSAFVPS